VTATNTIVPRAFAVWWKDLHRWGVKSFQSSQWQWPATKIKKLASALERRLESVDKASFELRPEHFLSLRFTGEVEPRDLHGKSEFKGTLFFAHAGDLIYSKIDVRNGAIGIVPAEIPVATVTSEFPVYRIKKDVALSEYIQLVFRTEHFRRIINGMVSGTSGRKRVQPDDLEDVEIPLPSLPEQNSIVARWRKAQDEIAAARERVEKRKTEIDARFFAELGLRSPAQDSMPKAFAVWWEDFLRWGVGFNYLKQSGAELTRGKYPVVDVGSLLELVQYGTSEKANTNNDGVAVIRMNNILDGELDLGNLKHLRLSKNEIGKLLLKDGDILFNRTNSKELVGKCAVFHAQGEYVFASYLIRIRTHSTKADADFLSYVINCPIGRQQINALSRQIIGQANVNSVELRGLQIPLPPLAVQKEIMERVAAGREEIAHERETADRLDIEINAEIEALILGTKTLREA
jgi:type I restriction enzyme S subunit